MPDKAVSLIDTAAARVAVSQHAVPPEVDDCRRRIQALETELEILGRETAIGLDHQARARGDRRQAGQGEGERWPNWRNIGTRRRSWSAKILELRAQAARGRFDRLKAEAQRDAAAAADPERMPSPPEERDKLLAELKQLQEKLKKFQGESR